MRNMSVVRVLGTSLLGLALIATGCGSEDSTGTEGSLNAEDSSSGAQIEDGGAESSEDASGENRGTPGDPIEDSASVDPVDVPSAPEDIASGPWEDSVDPFEPDGLTGKPQDPVGRTGWPCNSDADCLSTPEHGCLFGFCTERCRDSTGALPNACNTISGQSVQGQVWGCPSDFSFCMPGLVQDKAVICTGPNQCGFLDENLGCRAAVWLGNTTIEGVCLLSRGGKAIGEACEDFTECDSRLCTAMPTKEGSVRKCSQHCELNDDCGLDGLCVGVGFDTSGDGNAGAWAGMCSYTDGSQDYCTCQDSETCSMSCDDEGDYCREFINPGSAGLGAYYWCVAGIEGGADVGESCVNGEDCATGACYWSSNMSLGTEGYCAQPCPGGDADCPEDMRCGKRSLHSAGTPEDSSDDPIFKVCLRGNDGDPCEVSSKDWCAEGLDCVQNPDWGANFGLCTAPPPECTDDADCSGASACEEASCNEAGSCVYTLLDAYCAINAECIEAESVNPENACLVCNPENLSDTWTTLEDGSVCAEDSTCDQGVCVPNCTPATECAEGSECGSEDDGCGGTIECGTCAAGNTCNAGTCEAGNIAEVAGAAGTFTSLLAALSAAELADTIATGGPFTVFAPTDEAFEAALTALNLTFEELAADKDTLSDILLYHVVSGSVLAADVVTLTSATTLQGSDIAIEVVGDGVVLNGSVNVTATDILASNGVIHVVDAVLLPPECVPATECAEAVVCGQAGDGCGGTIECGTCDAGETCNAGVCEAPNTTIVHYASAWTSPYIHYGGEDEGSWTEVPGLAMSPDGTDRWIATLTWTGETLYFVFNDGADNWDNPPGVDENYSTSAAEVWVMDGVVYEAEPVGWTPCVAATQCAEGITCGTEDDGCGGTIDCGTCGAGETCNAGTCEADAPAFQCSPTYAECTASDFDDNDMSAMGEDAIIDVSIMGAMNPYSPTCLRVAVGQTVTIAASGAHPFKSVCAEDTVFDTVDGQTSDVSVTFETLGYYNYVCAAHPMMVGNIEVVSSP